MAVFVFQTKCIFIFFKEKKIPEIVKLKVC